MTALPAAMQTRAVPPNSALAAPILATVRIGAEFFLNATETRASVRHHLERMAQTGLTVIRIFTIWDQVEREKGQWNFERYDWIYEESERNGMFVANTLCAEDPPGWMGTTPFYHQWRDLLNPELRRYAELYLEKVVIRYKDHPAHGVWLLQNEPGIRENPGPYTLAAFSEWLKRRYGTVEELNKLWYRPLRHFEDAPLPAEPRTAGWSDYPSNLDWRRFRCDQLADQLEWIRTQIHQYHPGALTHINPPGLTSNMPASGRDLWRMKPMADFLGSSMHAAWHFSMFSRDDFGMAYGFCCDLVRSASAPAPWWVTELQAGPTVFTGNRPLNPSGSEITRWLWDGIGNGARATVFWLWHPRTEGNEAGEWALAGPAGEPTDRTRAAQSVAAVLRRHEAFFRAAKPVPARVAILYPRDAMLLYAVDGWRRPSDEIMQSLIGCYKALHRAHVPVDFLDTRELEAQQVSRYRVLYMPYAYALSTKSVAAVRDFVSGGGVVWADGLVGWKNEQGVTTSFPPGLLSEIFGFTLDDIDSAWNPFSLTGGRDDAGELWRCLIPRDADGALLMAGDGRPAAIEHTFGRGRALYFGTALTLGYFRRSTSQVTGWIAKPALEVTADSPVRLVEGPERLAFRALEAPDQVAAVVTNWDRAAQVVIEMPGSIRSMVEVIRNANVPVRKQRDRTIVELDVAENQSAILLGSTR